MSQKSPHTEEVVRRIIDDTFAQGEVVIVPADSNFRDLMRKKFDLVFFTGSTSVGRDIMAEASKTLTPVILELGGKSPCYINKTADINLAAKRIAWGKLLNSGQTCIAPDHVLVISVEASLRLTFDGAVTVSSSSESFRGCCAIYALPSKIGRAHV